MIRKITAAALFAVSAMALSVQPVAATPAQCMQQWENERGACGEDDFSCQFAADLNFTACMQALADEIPPEDNT